MNNIRPTTGFIPLAASTTEQLENDFKQRKSDELRKDLTREQTVADAPKAEKMNVRAPQTLFEYALYHKNVVMTSVFNRENFFQHPTLDNVFKTGSGNLSDTQRNQLNAIKKILIDAYKKSKTFKKMVDQRFFLINKNISPPVTIIPIEDDWHMSRMFNTRASFTDGKEAYIALNGKYLTDNSHQPPSFYSGEQNLSVVLKPDSFERVALHEIIHALTHSFDSERNHAAGEERYLQAIGKKRNAIYSVDEQTDYSDVNKNIAAGEDDFFRVSANDIPGLTYDGDIFVSKVNIIGENDALTNTVLREIDPNYKPLLSYGPLVAYWGYEGELHVNDELFLNIPDQQKVIEYLLRKDQTDGQLNYPFSPFSQNRKLQVHIDSEIIKNKVNLPPK